MNHTYRLVWNRTLSMFVAVSECARTMGKSSGGKALALATVVMAAASAPALAVPYNTVIDTSQASYDASTLAPSGTIQFQGGTLRTDVNGATLSQGFTIDSHGAFVDQFGMTSNFTGPISDAVGGVPGAMTIVNSGSGGGVTFSGNTTYSGATTITSGAMLTLAGAAQLSSSNVVNHGALTLGNLNYGLATVNGLAGSGTVNLGATNLWIAHASGDFSGSIGGTGGLVIQNGTQNLSGTSTYSGDTQLQSGATLTLNGGGKLASSAIAFSSGATLDISGGAGAVGMIYGSGAVVLGSNTLTLNGAQYIGNFTGTVTGSGGLTFAGGTHLFNTALAYTGATQLNTGANLYLGDAGSIASSSSVIMNGGNLTAYASTGGTTLTSLTGTSGNVTLNGVNLTLSNASGNFGGALLGTGGLVVAAGTETLAGSSFNTGATTIASGATLALAGTGSIATSSGVTANGTFDISAASAPVNIANLAGGGSVVLGANTLALTAASGTFGGRLSGNGGLTIAGGQLTLSDYGTYFGQTTINAGAGLNLSGTMDLYYSNVLNNGTFDVSAVNGATAVNALNGSGSVALGANNLTVFNASGDYSGSISGTGSLSVYGGAQNLSGVSTYSGSTIVSSGATLSLTGAGKLMNSAVQFNGAVLDVSGNVTQATVGALVGTGAVQLGANTLTLNGTPYAQIFAGTITGSGGLVFDHGIQFIDSALAYTGATRINTGATLYLTDTGSVANSSTVNMQGGHLVVAANTGGTTVTGLSGASGEVTATGVNLTLSNASGTYGGALDGTGGLAVAGGIQTLSGTQTYSGATRVDAGARLIITGAGGGIYNSASVLDNGGIDVSGTTYPTAFQNLSGTGTLALGATSTYLNGSTGNFGGVISGSGTVYVNGASQTLSGANTFTGVTQVNANSTLVVASTGSLAASSKIIANGILDLSNTTSVNIKGLGGVAGGQVRLGATALTIGGTDGVFQGVVSGAGSLHLAANATALWGANTYTGATTVDAGATLTLANGGSIAASSGLVDNGAFNIAAATGNTTLAKLTGPGTVYLGTKQLNLAAQTGAFNGVISGTGGVNVNAGTLVLAGANTYSGATTVAAGATLGLAARTAIASSSVVDNGVLDISAAGGSTGIAGLTGTGTVTLGANNLAISAAAGTFDGMINGTGGFGVTGGIQTLSKVQTYTGATTVATGAKLILAGNGSIAASSGLVDNGIVDIAGATSAAQLATLSGSGAVNLGANQLTLTAANDVFNGAVQGTGKLAIAAGTETLSGVNTYTGATTIAAGATLALTTQRAIANSAVVDNGTLDLSTSNGGASVAGLTGAGVVKLGANQLVVSNAAGTFAGNVNGSGGLLVTSGVQTLTGVNTYTGLTEIGVGAELAISGDGSITSSSGVLDNGTLTVATNQLATMTSLSGSGILNLNGQSVTFTQGSANFTGAITGTGKIVVAGGSQGLGGNNTIAGPVSITSGGTLKVATNSAIGDVANGLVLNNGTLENTASFTMARTVAITGTGTLLVDAGTTLASSGAVSGSGTLVKAGAGTLVLGGDNTQLTGGVAVNAGTLQVATAKALGNGPLALNGGVLETTANLALAQNVTVAGGAGIFVDTATTTTLSGAISTAAGTTGCFSKTGGGTLTLTGSGVFGTGLCVANGMLRENGVLSAGFINVATTGTLRGAGTISGPMTVAGILAPGNSPGTLTTSSSVTMLAGSTFQADINGTGTGTGPGNYSRLLVTGAGQFNAGGATLAPNLVNITGADTYTAYVPKVGDDYRIISAAGGLVGRFAPLVQPAGLAAGTRLGVFYDLDSSHSIDLRVLPTSYAALVTGNGNAQASGAVLDTIMNADQAGTATAAQSRIASTISNFSSSAVATLTSNLSGQVHAAMAAAAPLAGQAVQATVVRQFDTTSATSALWADLGANRAQWDHDAHASGFTANRGQLTIGADAFRNDRYRVGVGFSHARANLAADAGSGTLRENILFAYGQHQGDVIGIDAMAGAGRTDWQTERANPLGAGALVSGLDGRNTLASIGLSTPWQADGATFKPFVRVLWQRTERDAGGEGGAIAALALPEYSASGTRITAGLSGNTQGGAIGQAPYTMQYSVGVGRDNGALAATRVDTSLAGINATVLAPQAGRSFIQAAVSGTVIHSANAASYYGISTELHSGRADVSLTGGLRYAF